MDGPTPDGFESDIYIKWRVEGTEGLAKARSAGRTIPRAARARCAIAAARRRQMGEPAWSTMWFPDAFRGVMEQLQYAVKTGTEPFLSGADNVKTMALVEAAYRSATEKRAVRLSEFAI